MGNIKIHEIAKELNLNSKEVLKKAEELGIAVKSHLSAVDEETAKRIKNSFGKRPEKQESKTKKDNKKAIAVFGNSLFHNQSPKLTESALFTISIELLSRQPIFSLRRCLSIVLTCSSKTIESFARPEPSALT